MRADTAEWVRFAESDFAAACRELAVAQGPNAPAVCFHAYQCVQRLIRALIVDRRGKMPATGDLEQLSAAATALEANWSPVKADLDQLRPGTLVYGEPGSFPTPRAALEALASCRRLRSDLLTLL